MSNLYTRDRLVNVEAKTLEDLAKAIARDDLTVISALLRRALQLDPPAEKLTVGRAAEKKLLTRARCTNELEIALQQQSLPALMAAVQLAEDTGNEVFVQKETRRASMMITMLQQDVLAGVGDTGDTEELETIRQQTALWEDKYTAMQQQEDEDEEDEAAGGVARAQDDADDDEDDDTLDESESEMKRGSMKAEVQEEDRRLMTASLTDGQSGGSAMAIDAEEIDAMTPGQQEAAKAANSIHEIMAQGQHVMAGFLVKRAVKSEKNWKRRYFCLRGEAITYHKTRDDAAKMKDTQQALGVVYLSADTIVDSGVKNIGAEGGIVSGSTANPALAPPPLLPPPGGGGAAALLPPPPTQDTHIKKQALDHRKKKQSVMGAAPEAV